MPASKAERAAAADRRKRAIALRIAGLDWQAVADQAGYASRGAAYNAVNAALKANLEEQNANAEELRQLTVARYDRLQAAFWPKALKGDPKAAEVVLKCLAGRAKIEGVDAPAKVEHSGQVVTYEINGVDLEQLQ